MDGGRVKRGRAPLTIDSGATAAAVVVKTPVKPGEAWSLDKEMDAAAADLPTEEDVYPTPAFVILVDQVRANCAVEVKPKISRPRAPLCAAADSSLSNMMAASAASSSGWYESGIASRKPMVVAGGSDPCEKSTVHDPGGKEVSLSTPAQKSALAADAEIANTSALTPCRVAVTLR